MIIFLSNFQPIFFCCSTPFYKIMVPTVDTVRYDFLVYSLLQAKRPVLLTGPVGTGKTSLAQKVLQRLDPKIYSLLVINLSAQVGQKTDSSSVYLFMTPHKTKFNSFFCGVVSQLEQMYKNVHVVIFG